MGREVIRVVPASVCRYEDDAGREAREREHLAVAYPVGDAGNACGVVGGAEDAETRVRLEEVVMAAHMVEVMVGGKDGDQADGAAAGRVQDGGRLGTVDDGGVPG